MELLEELLRYEIEPILNAKLKFHMLKAVQFGSPAVQDKILTMLHKLIKGDADGALFLLGGLRMIMMTEMDLEDVVDETQRELWK
jgi:hypothetical protein